jgi:hypothetical protein
MTLTTKILAALLLLLTSGLFASNHLLKKEYERADKNDSYWIYGKILEQPFHHLSITGGNLSRIAYEQSTTASVKVLKEWDGYEKQLVKAVVKNDTLFIDFPNTYRNVWEKRYMDWNTLVRVFAPELLSVTGVDTKFEMFKTTQKSIAVNMSGKSSFEIESMITGFDSINVVQKDSSQVVFEMSPEFKKTESFHVNYLKADIRGYSFLDIGHGQVDSLQLSLADSSAVLLSGGTLKKQAWHR